MADQKPPERKRVESVEELKYLQQIYQNQYTLVAQQINSTLELIRQLESAHSTIEHMDAVKGRQGLVPIGADAFISGKIDEAGSVLVGIGAGYLVEKSMDEAKQFFSKFNEQEMQEVNRLMKAKAELENAMIEISYKIDELSH